MLQTVSANASHAALHAASHTASHAASLHSQNRFFEAFLLRMFGSRQMP
jgi:hypothetical protein